MLGTAKFLRGLLKLDDDLPVREEVAQALMAGVNTVVIQVAHSSGLNCDMLLALGQVERARLLKEQGDKEPPPSSEESDDGVPF